MKVLISHMSAEIESLIKDSIIGPGSCYDEGKRCAETLFRDYHNQNNVNIKIVRIFNTYGPNMNPGDGRVVSNFIVQALKGGGY